MIRFQPNEIITEFDRYLDEQSLNYEAIVIGGAALALLGIITRTTRDVDLPLSLNFMPPVIGTLTIFMIKDVVNLIGVSREPVSRILADLRDAGILKDSKPAKAIQGYLETSNTYGSQPKNEKSLR